MKIFKKFSSWTSSVFFNENSLLVRIYPHWSIIPPSLSLSLSLSQTNSLSLSLSLTFAFTRRRTNKHRIFHSKICQSNVNITRSWAVVVVVAQLVEQSLPIPKVRGSFPVIGKNLFIFWTFVYCQLCVEKTKIKKKEAGNGPFLKYHKIFSFDLQLNQLANLRIIPFYFART